MRFSLSFSFPFFGILCNSHPSPSHFSAPVPCQSKSSGKPEINPQEFTQLQQQLQDLKEQVRRQERLLHSSPTTSTEHTHCLRSSLVKRACRQPLPQFLHKPKRFRKPGKHIKVTVVLLQGSNLEKLFIGSFAGKLKIVPLLVFPSLSVLPQCTTFVAFVYSTLLCCKFFALLMRSQLNAFFLYNESIFVEYAGP